MSYVLESSADLTNWNAISTNMLAGSSFNFANPVPPSAATKFYRATAQP